MNWDEVLRHNRHGQNTGHHTPLGPCFCLRFSAFILGANLGNQPIGQQFGQPRGCHCHGKGTQHGVTQGNLRTTREAFLEGNHCGIEPHTGGKTTDQGANKQR